MGAEQNFTGTSTKAKRRSSGRPETLADWLRVNHPPSKKEWWVKQNLRPLTDEQIAEVIELRVMGVYWENLAEVFGVSTTTLQRYVERAEQMGMGAWRPY